VPLRLTLSPEHIPEQVDGIWWVQSRNLQTEAADLVDNFPSAAGRIDRLMFSRPDWDVLPDAPTPNVRWIAARRGDVRAGSYPSDDTHLMIVKLFSGQRLNLLVIPADADPRHVEQATAQILHPTESLTTATLIKLAMPDSGRPAHGTWDDDGGTSF
jgi:hypothetical protein